MLRTSKVARRLPAGPRGEALVAVATTLVATVAALLLEEVAHVGLVAPMLGAVAVAAWLGGRRPGLAVVALGGASLALVLGLQDWSGRELAVRLVVFALVGALVAELGGRLQATAAAALAARESAEAVARLEAERGALLEAQLQRAPGGFGLLDADGRFDRVTEGLATLHGIPVERHVGRRPDELPIPSPAATAHAAAAARILHGERGVEVEILPDGPDAGLHARTWQAAYYGVDLPGRRPAVGMLVVDVSARRRQEREAGLQAQAARRLAEPLAMDVILDEALRVAVPAFADAGMIDVLDDRGELVRVAAAHAEPDLLELQRGIVVGREGDVAAAIASGEARLVAPVTEEHLARASVSPDHLEARRALAPTSMVIVPLLARRRTLGAMTFTTRGTRPLFDDESLRFAREFARLASLAVDNVRLWDAERSARAVLDGLFEHAPVGFGFYDRDLRFRRVNEALARINGLPADEHLGRPIEEVVPDVPGLRDVFERVMATGRPEPRLELEGRTGATDEPRAWLTAIYPVLVDDAPVGVGAVVVDVTEQRATEAARRRGEERLQLLVDVSAVLAAELDLEARLDGLMRATVPRFADVALVDLIDGDAPPRRVAVAAVDPAVADLLRGLAPDLPGSPSVTVAGTGDPILLEDAPPDLASPLGGEGDAAGQHGALAVRSVIVVPLRARRRTLGTITFCTSARHSDRRYGPEDLRFAGLLAARAGLLLDNARLFELERAARRRNDALQGATAALSAAVTPADVAVAVLREGIAAAGMAAGAVYGLDDAGEALVLLAHDGYPEGTMTALGRLALADDFPVTHAAVSGAPVWIEGRADIERRYPHLADPQAAGRVGSVCALPLVVERRLLGVLALSRPEARPFDEDERALLVALAAQLAQALERARLYAAERVARQAAVGAAQRLARLQEVTAELARALSPDDVLRVLVEQGSRALRAARGFAAFVDGDGRAGPLVHEVRQGPVPPALAALPEGVGIGRAPAGREARVDWDARPADLVPGAPPVEGSLVAVRVGDGEDLRAVAGFCFAEPVSIGGPERVLVETIADLCAQALQRAGRYAVERRVSLVLQRSLLPVRLPSVPGARLAGRYLPATQHVQAGGDWYDGFPVGARSLAVALGDVAGHGAEAAGVMAQLRSALHAFAMDDPSPDEVLQRLSAFAESLPPETFATVVYGSLDLDARVLRYARAGHPPPVLMDGAGVRLLEDVNGPPIGVEVEEPYRGAVVPLEPGSRLVLYSDGLVERRDRRIDHGLDRLVAAVDAARDAPDPAAMADHLLSACLPEGHADDVALLVLFVD